MEKTAAVIGSGMGGLAVAARLAKLGWQVDVFDKAPGPGGKNVQELWEGYRFDTGPSLLTLPEVFRELFTFCDRDWKKYFTLVPLNPLCHYWFPDGSNALAPGNPTDFIRYFSELGWAPEKVLKDFFLRVENLNKIAGTLFLEKSLQEPSTYFSMEGLKSILGLPFIDAFRTMHQAHESYFKDPRLVQLFDRYGTYNGSNPFKAPATLDIIPWVEYSHGGWGVKEGIHGLAKGIYNLAKEMGVQFYFNAPVSKIISTQGRVRGLRFDKVEKNYGLVVSNADIIKTYELLEDTKAPWSKKYKKSEPSSSGFVFYWGMKKVFPEMGLHNIFFSQDYEKEFHHIFNDLNIPEDPTVYVNITSKLSPEDAPPGGENWFVLVNTPFHQDQDWKALGTVLRTRILARLEQSLGYSVEPFISMERTLTPLEIQDRTGSTFGSLYGLSSNSWNAAFNRHPNKSKRHKGLYLVGGSAHPGGGMPLVLLSAKITSELVQKYERGSP